MHDYDSDLFLQLIKRLSGVGDDNTDILHDFYSLS